MVCLAVLQLKLGIILNQFVHGKAECWIQLAMAKRSLTKFLSESEWRFRKFSFFDKQWDISVSRDTTGRIEPLSKDEEISEVIQIKLLDHEACLLTLSDQVCLILKHEDYYVVFDPNIQDSCGMATHRGRSALVFNTSFLDLMHHIDNLVASLRAEHYTVVGINVTPSHPSINGNYSDACNEIDAGSQSCV